MGASVAVERRTFVGWFSQHEEGCLWRRQDVALAEACTCNADEQMVEFDFDTPDPLQAPEEFVRRCRRGLLDAAMEQSKGSE